MGRHGSKSNENTGELTGIPILNFGIFKISGPFGAPGPGPGPGLAQGPDFGPKFWQKNIICVKNGFQVGPNGFILDGIP